jgi:uncharacterized protein YjbI with pentapeptide repeats
MANEEHWCILKKGGVTWNKWRNDNPLKAPNFRRAALSGRGLSGANLMGADLYGASLSGANLTGADLRGANLSGAYLQKAKLSKADLSNAKIVMANLRNADLTGANLSGANLDGAILSEADLRGANLSKAVLHMSDLSRANLGEANLGEANLEQALFIRTDLRNANLNGCSVYGISAWDLDLTGASQTNLIVTPSGQCAITVDNLEVAQFIYLMITNKNLRSIVDAISQKLVLILGRFTPDRKDILGAIRDELRKRNLLPVLFDFEKPSSRDITETISTLAHMAKFVIADITDAKSIPQELQRIVPDLPSVPIQPLLQAEASEYGMFEHFKRYPWVLAIHHYRNIDDLLASLSEKVIAPAEAKLKEMREKSSGSTPDT